MQIVTCGWRRAGALAAIGIMAFGAGACADDGSETDAARCVGCPTFGASDMRIRVDADQDFVIELDANPSTGYRWEVTAVSDPEVVRMIADTYVPPHMAAPGAGGKQRLEFAGDRQGTTTVTIRSARAFDPADPTARELVFTVTVR